MEWMQNQMKRKHLYTRYMHSALMDQVNIGLSIEYKLYLGLDGARGVYVMVYIKL
jgi:hypothetical protein